jgi:hypothetical protein
MLVIFTQLTLLIMPEDVTIFSQHESVRPLRERRKWVKLIGQVLGQPHQLYSVAKFLIGKLLHYL